MGGARLRFAPTRHYIQTFAIRYDCDGASVTYSADTAPEPRVSALAEGCDVFLCEATLGPGDADGRVRGHMTAEEAGALGRDAGAGRLVLTHYGSGTTEDELRERAASSFDGEIVIADDGIALPLGPAL